MIKTKHCRDLRSPQVIIQLRKTSSPATLTCLESKVVSKEIMFTVKVGINVFLYLHTVHLHTLHDFRLPNALVTWKLLCLYKFMNLRFVITPLFLRNNGC